MKTGLYFIACLILSVTCTKNKGFLQEKSDSSMEESLGMPSQLPEDIKWKLIWHDEFNGTELDTTKWDYRLHLMQVRHSTWTTKGAELDGNGNLLLKLYEKDGQFYSSHLQTGRNYLDRPGDQYGSSNFVWPIAEMEPPKFVHKYGYYEIRCKLPTQEGWWAAFWMQSPEIGSTLNPAESGVEFDIMENFSRDGIISHNIHWNGYGNNHEHAGSGKRKLQPTENGFHTFGFHWSSSGYVFYVDGKISWEIDGPVSHREQFILISTECKGYRQGGPSPELKGAKLPDYFIVDYIRVFDEVSGN
ncbi:MAG: glycoside hydrolase family 16 protein [Cyclobacteriaceae bacterium]|nr:glycoside hydrolase family 16 protein [Cyclobacteriaceae bacterium]